MKYKRKKNEKRDFFLSVIFFGGREKHFGYFVVRFNFPPKSMP